MSTNRVSVILDAVDKLSPVLRGIGNTSTSLGANAVLLGNLYTKAFEGAAAAIGQLGNRFSEAADMQTAAMGLAGQFSAMTGKSYEGAKTMIAGMNQQFAVMAAALPGATQDYKDLGLAISDTLIKANTDNGKFNEKAFNQQTMSLTKSLGLLKATNKELSTTDVQLFFTKFVEGASESELKILKLNERMPGLMGELEKAQKKLGLQGQKIKDLTVKDRAKIFEIASAGLTPPEMIKDLEQTASSQIESLKTALFDQEVGLFGFLRSVTTENGKARTVMDGFSKLLSSVFGPSGLFGAAGKALGRLGFKGIDPMLVLYKGLMKASEWITSVAKIIDGLKLPNLGTLNLGNLSTLGQNLGTWMGGLFNQGWSWIQTALSGLLNEGTFAQIGIGLAGALNAVIGYVAGLWQSINWDSVGVVAGQIAIGLIQGIGSFLLSFDYMQVVNLINQAFLSIITFGAGLARTLGAAIGTGIMSLGGRVAEWVASKVEELFKVFTDALSSVFEKITNAVNAVRSWVPPVFGGTLGQSTPSSTPVTNHAEGLNVGGLFGALGREVSRMPFGAKPVVANSSETILNQGQVGQLMNTVSSIVSGGLSPIEMVKSIMGSGTGTSGVNNPPNFSPQIVVNASQGMDTNALANLVMSRIESKWAEYKMSFL